MCQEYWPSPLIMVSLDYPLTRPFPSRLLAPVAFTGAAFSIIVLTLLNTALTAYQITTIVSANFNENPTFWYSPFLPAALKKGGGNCDPHLLSAGSVVSTDTAVFAWTVDRVIRGDAGRSGFKYTGFNLNSCDITEVNFDGDIASHSATITAGAQCNPSPEVSFLLRTEFTLSELKQRNPTGRYGRATILGGSTEGSQSLGFAGQACDSLVGLGANDLLRSILNLTATLPDAIDFLVLNTVFDFCPADESGANCTTTLPTPSSFDSSVTVYANSSFVFESANTSATPDSILNPGIAPAMNNLLQVVAACARVDFGQNNTNNILLHPLTALSSGTLKEVNPSEMLPIFASPEGSVVNGTAQLPVPWRGPTAFDVAFQCRIKTAKSPGEAFISVLVATLSMFMSGWATFMFIAAFLVKRRLGDDSNTCIGHHDPTTSQTRPQPYTMTSGMSDYSKTSAIPLAMPSPEPMIYSGNGYQYLPAGQTKM